MLYARRFFPYYVYNILGGIEEDGLLSSSFICWSIHRTSSGTGAVYSFDPVGSYEREACRAAGAAQSLVQPFLDNQVSSATSLLFLGCTSIVHLRLTLKFLRSISRINYPYRGHHIPHIYPYPLSCQ